MKFKMIHENYNVSDLERSMRFYEEALGLKEARRKTGDDYIIVYLSNAEAEFELERITRRNMTSAKRSFTLPSVPTILRPLTPCTRRWGASASKTRKWASTLSRIRTATGSRLSLHAERTAGKNPAEAGFLPAILSQGGF